MGAEERKFEDLLEKNKISIPILHVEFDKTAAEASTTSKAISLSVPSSPRSPVKNQSGKINCLCSPTTHPGSFRCRYHRNNEPKSKRLARNSMSVGSNLSELARKSPG